MSTKNTMDCMLDFETLGTKENSVLLSSGLCIFNRNTGEIIDQDYKEYVIRAQICKGYVVDPETVDWWKSTNQAELERLVYSGTYEDPDNYLVKLFQRLKGSYKHIWTRGCMDAHILQYHVPGIPYWTFKDVRTLDGLTDIKMSKNSHNALDDCKNQVAYVCSVLKRITYEEQN